MERRSSGRVPPHSQLAERSLLGACLLSADACSVLNHEVGVEDFYRPAWGHVAQCVLDLYRDGRKVEVSTVTAELTRRGRLEMVGGSAAILNLLSEAPSTSSATTHARLIVDLAVRRRLIGAAAEMFELGYQTDGDLAEALDTSRRLLGEIESPGGAEVEGGDVDWFIAQDRKYDWLVPDLIERGDRFIWTAAEGAGKSTLLRQMGVQLAAGLHPWTERGTAPITVLLVDLENSAMSLQRALRDLRTSVVSTLQPRLDQPGVEVFDPARMRVISQPYGLNLLSRKDRRWLTAQVQGHRPDLLITGPLYKMLRSDPTEEKPAADVIGFLDDLRGRFSLSLMLEAHSPHERDGGGRGARVLRPYGASIWMRWPEFGFGISAADDDGTYRIVQWRGARDRERPWPHRLAQGGKWPWARAYGRHEHDEEEDF